MKKLRKIPTQIVKLSVTSILCTFLSFSNVTGVLAADTTTSANTSFSASPSFASWDDMGTEMVLKDGDSLSLAGFDEEANFRVIVEENARVKIYALTSDDPFEALNIFCEPNVDLTIENLKFNSKLYDLNTAIDDTEIDGILKERNYTAGIYFSEGKDNFLRVIGTNSINKEVNFDQNNLAKLNNSVFSPGQKQTHKNFGAAVNVSPLATLSITGEDRDTSSLNVTGLAGAAAIGGGFDSGTGNINFLDVSIIAKGDGAAIGGGASYTSGGSVGKLSFTNTVITATGKNGAGIGGGSAELANKYDNPDSTATFNGGNVDEILIQNSKVNSIGEKGAGIGGGSVSTDASLSYNLTGGTFNAITISKSEITTTGKKGAGIGGGGAVANGKFGADSANQGTAQGGGSLIANTKSGIIKINNSQNKIIATGNAGAAIGGGSAAVTGARGTAMGGNVNEITINEGFYDLAASSSAAIGGGSSFSDAAISSYSRGGSSGKVTISKASVNAKTNLGGAAIGGGSAVSRGITEADAQGGNAITTVLQDTTLNASVTNQDSTSDVIGAGVGGGVAVVKNTLSTKVSQGRGGVGGEILISGGITTIKTNSQVTKSASIGGGGAIIDKVINKQIGSYGGVGGKIAIVNNAKITAPENTLSPSFGNGSLGGATDLSVQYAKQTEQFTQLLIATGLNQINAPASLKTFKTEISVPKLNQQTQTIYTIANPFEQSNLPKTFDIGASSSNNLFTVTTANLPTKNMTFYSPTKQSATVEIGVAKLINLIFK